MKILGLFFISVCLVQPLSFSNLSPSHASKIYILPYKMSYKIIYWEIIEIFLEFKLYSFTAIFVPKSCPFWVQTELYSVKFKLCTLKRRYNQILILTKSVYFTQELIFGQFCMFYGETRFSLLLRIGCDKK